MCVCVCVCVCFLTWGLKSKKWYLYKHSIADSKTLMYVCARTCVCVCVCACVHFLFFVFISRFISDSVSLYLYIFSHTNIYCDALLFSSLWQETTSLLSFFFSDFLSLFYLRSFLVLNLFFFSIFLFSLPFPISVSHFFSICHFSSSLLQRSLFKFSDFTSPLLSSPLCFLTL